MVYEVQVLKIKAFICVGPSPCCKCVMTLKSEKNLFPCTGRREERGGGVGGQEVEVCSERFTDWVC